MIAEINQGVARLIDYVRKDKPKKLREGFAFKEPLSHGWMLPYLLGIDDLSWRRWAHWQKVMEADALIDDPIPQISWTGEERNGPGRKMLEKALGSITRCGDWAGWSSWTYFDYLLDWLLFGLGNEKQKEEPKVPGGCEGASERLYQIFNLEPLLAYPHDYFGDILAENNFGRHSGFFPTPMHLCQVMVEMQMTGEDMRTKTVCDPALGTGRMLLAASNFSYRLYGNDINETVIKACLVNGYLYAPWLVRPFPFFQTYESAEPEAKAVPQITQKTEELMIPQFELPQAETVFNLASEEAQDGEKVTAENTRRAKEKAEAKAKEEKEQLCLL